MNAKYLFEDTSTNVYKRENLVEVLLHTQEIKMCLILNTLRIILKD